MAVVYFLQRIDGCIKIGTTRNLKSRWSSIETGAGPLKLLALVSGSYREEAILHGKFAAARVHGEWFSPTADLMDFIDNAKNIDRPKTQGKSGQSVRFAIATHGQKSPAEDICHMEATKRLCAVCLEDWADEDSPVGLCLACGFEHERSLELRKMPFGVRNDDDRAEWWGPTMADVDREDLDGFFIAHTTDANDAPLRDEYMLERWEQTLA